MTLRIAVPDDAERIAEIHVTSWRRAYRGLLSDEHLVQLDPDVVTGEWRAGIEHPHPEGSSTWTFEMDGKVVGYVRAGPSRDEDASEGTGEIYGFYLDPAAWGRRQGRAMMRAVEDELSGRGYHELTLWVVARNERARRFYERAGWSHEPGPTNLCFGAPEVRYRKTL
jgi:GNAT superfamily N-acetyltransferase